ncbi:LOB domain-containing protein 10 [Apostasia shenzhenica]|uniref:LOB domain-containing protein 10 n=1 Tax=Apostasia shenzhenica TaxID=1088818 RepID=A0A2I0AFG0_9ASPA|nr:LOB domain-containing protein 10 [Apostasia shenzhenica]
MPSPPSSLRLRRICRIASKATSANHTPPAAPLLSPREVGPQGSNFSLTSALRRNCEVPRHEHPFLRTRLFRLETLKIIPCILAMSSPCAACKCRRKRCAEDCVFAPYFPPDQTTKFTVVQKVFGASNVAKILKDLSPDQREDAVTFLVFEAEARLQDPVNGCVGYVQYLQDRLHLLQRELCSAKEELFSYTSPAPAAPFAPHQQLPGGFDHGGFDQQPVMPMSGFTGVEMIENNHHHPQHDHDQQQIISDADQLLATALQNMESFLLE